MRRIVLFLFLQILFLSTSCDRSSTVYSTQNSNTVPAIGTLGMVSSAHPLATKAGLDILKSGGNAFDAAVSIAAMLNVVEPMMSGIGGYGTVLVYDAEKEQALFLNCSGRIPKNVDSDVYRAPTPNYKKNRRGAKAVSTPGNVIAWESMWKRFGSIGWEELFETAIKTAENGVILNDRTARLIKSAYPNFPDHAKEFYGKDNVPLSTGELLIQKDLADSFRKIAKQGAKVVHGGEIGQAIDAAMQKAGGFLSIEDMKINEAEWYDPIRIDYHEYQVITASPPSTAFPSLIRLGMMSLYDNQAVGHNSSEYLHRFAEVTKHAFWCRLRYAGDPEKNPPPLETLLSNEYWSRQILAISPDEAKQFVPPSNFANDGINTTHFVVADKWGNIVSATQTLGNSFGSKIMPKGTGIWLNNSLAYCTFEPKGNPMDAHAGRHKLSGDCPTLIFKNGKPRVAIGTPGGHTIGQTVPQMVLNMIEFGMNIQQAIAASRISFIEPDRIAVETGIAESIRDQLIKLGHNVQVVKGLGNAHGLAIEYENGKPIRFTGGADPRGKGIAEGY